MKRQSMTKKDLIKEINKAVSGSNNYEEMINKVANYIILNFRLKKVITPKTQERKE